MEISKDLAEKIEKFINLKEQLGNLEMEYSILKKELDNSIRETIFDKIDSIGINFMNISKFKDGNKLNNGVYLKDLSYRPNSVNCFIPIENSEKYVLFFLDNRTPINEDNFK